MVRWVEARTTEIGILSPEYVVLQLVARCFLRLFEMINQEAVGGAHLSVIDQSSYYRIKEKSICSYKY